MKRPKIPFFTRLCFIALFLVTFQLQGQGEEEVYGRIIDASTGDPVSYATILFENSQNGIVANEQGDFRLPMDYVKQDIMLIISSIGYATLKVRAATLKIAELNTLRLQQKIEELDIVVLKAEKKSSGASSLDPENIIFRAIKRIPQNYPTEPHSFIGYYRDYQVVNNSYYNFNEGILEVFDKGFQTKANDPMRSRAALYYYDLNEGFYVDSTLINATYGDSKLLDLDGNILLETKIKNELELLNIHNPIRNFDKSTFSFIYELRSDFVINHNFKLNRVVYEDEEPLYEIGFITKDSELTEYIGEGKVYISQENYAIHRLDYVLYSNPGYSSFGTVNSSLSNTATERKGSERVTFFEVSVAYKRKGDLMYPNYITFNNRFVVKGEEPFKIEDLQLDPKSKAVLITFNKPLDPETIGNLSNYKFKYKRNRLIVKSVTQKRDNQLLVKLVDWDPGADGSGLKSDDFDVGIKRIRDLTGSRLNQSIKVTGYQFREMFTQEVFDSKLPHKGLYFVNKLKSLHRSPINKTSRDLEKYWVNSPLKKSKN